MSCSVTVIKKFPYRGDANEEYSNRWYLSGPTPSTVGDWRTLFDAIVAQEKTVLPSLVSMVAGYGYDSDAKNAHAVWSVDLRPSGSVAGTWVPSGAIKGPGDLAVWVRWKTARLTEKGKPIYLRKYYHPAYFDSSNTDVVLPAQKTLLTALGNKFKDGSFLDGRTIRAPGTTIEQLLSATGGDYVTTRTLKRRGKRPKAATP